MGQENDQVIDYIKKFKNKLDKKLNVNKLILFGSRARKDNKIDSDVDILIVSSDFENVKSFKRSPSFYLMWDFNCDVDFICLTPDELKEKEKQISIIHDAIQDGIEV